MAELPVVEREITAAVEHLRKGRYYNPGITPHGFTALLKWVRNRNLGPWRKWIPSQPGPPPPACVDGEALRVTFVNHATVLLQTQGLNVLTDPVWSDRVSPVSFAGPRRHRAPGIRFEDLPRIDGILISHNHYDHLDVPTLRRLLERDAPEVFCPMGVGKLLRRIGFREVVELDWWEARKWRGVRIDCVPAQHFSARTPFDRNRTLWCGWVLEAGSGNVYFAADTGFGDFFAEVRERFAPLRLALLPIGAYEPEWFMGPIHMTPEEAVAAQQVLGAGMVVPIHYGTFSLADDGETAPVERLLAAIEGRADEQRFVVIPEGEGRLVP